MIVRTQILDIGRQEKKGMEKEQKGKCLLKNSMRIQSQVLAIGISVDVVIAYTDEFGVERGGETRVTLDGTSGHWLLPTKNVQLDSFCLYVR